MKPSQRERLRLVLEIGLLILFGIWLTMSAVLIVAEAWRLVERL